jgi:hypothetical protein
MTEYVAQLDDDNVVVNVVVSDSVEWAVENFGGVWVGSDNRIGLNYTYDEELDAFIPPKPFESWILNEDTFLWGAPIPYPNDGSRYEWDESHGDWVEVVSETE